MLRWFAALTITLGLFLGMVYVPIQGESCDLDCLEKQIKDLEEQKKLSEAATTPLESEVNKLTSQIQSIGNQLKLAENQLNQLSTDIAEREIRLANDYLVMASRVKRYYKRSRSTSGLLMLFSSQSAAEATREVTYQATLNEQDRQIIAQTTQELLQLEADKKELETNQVHLASLQKRLDEQANFYEGEIAKAKQYQSQLSNQIADLTKRQQEILAEKQGTFQTSVGDVPLADDVASRPDYNPGFSPAFAAFSFGAPHFKGMSQYGAYGRAKSGQNAEEILKAYYGDGIDLKKDYSTGITISVDGHGSYNIEDYVMRIYEVPASWANDGGMEALKAQAVAARSYALARTNNGASSICATEACQVFKPEPKGGAWAEAVNATRGWVVTANGSPLSTMYASTSGGYQQSYSYNGYSTPAFWDAQGGRDGWTAQAYEKIAGSPWFYKGWYKSRSGDACGRSHPWLNGAEMADILNAWVVLYKHNQGDDRVTPNGPCWGGSPYSLDDLRSKAQSLSTGYQTVSGVSVNYGTNGLTANLTFQTDNGSVTISGEEFRKAFNLRAPGRVALKSGLFNIEKK